MPEIILFKVLRASGLMNEFLILSTKIGQISSLGRAMDRQSRGWGFESPAEPFNFRMLKEFGLITFIKPGARKTLNIVQLVDLVSVYTVESI